MAAKSTLQRARRSLGALLLAAGVAGIVGLLAMDLWSSTPVAEPAHGERGLQRGRMAPARGVAPGNWGEGALPCSEGASGLKGVVRTLADGPIAGARVCAVCADCDVTAAPPGPCVEAGPDGGFTLDNLVQDWVFVTASAEGYRVGLARAGAAIYVADECNGSPLVVRLEAGESTVSGVVIDATGGPVPGAQVQVAHVGYAVRTTAQLSADDAGHFAAAVPLGDVWLRAEAPGYAPALLQRRLPTVDATLVLMPSGSVTGTVIDADSGQPQPGVEVVAHGETAHALALPVITDATGEFTIEGLRPGRYVFAAKGAHHRSVAPLQLTLGFAEQRSGVQLVVQGGAAVGGQVRVRDTAEPCTAGFVQLGMPGPLSLAGLVGNEEAWERDEAQQSAILPTVRGEIDPMGRVSLGGLPPGKYHVELRCEGHVYASGPVTVDMAESDRELQWEVIEGLSLTIEAQDEQGEPVPYPYLALEFPRGLSGQRGLMGLPTDEAGQAHLVGNLLPGRYVIHGDESWGLAPLPVELAANSGHTRVVV